MALALSVPSVTCAHGQSYKQGIQNLYMEQPTGNKVIETAVWCIIALFYYVKTGGPW